MKELIVIVVMFVFGDMQESGGMTQYLPYDKLSACMKDKRLIENDRPTKHIEIAIGNEGNKRATCGLNVVEMTDGEMTAMFQMDEIAAGTKMSKGGTNEVPVEAMINWNNAKKDKWASNNN